MTKKTVCGLLAMALLLCGALGAMADEPMTMMGLDAMSGRQWENNQFFVRMGELTGTTFTFEQYTDAAKYQEAKNGLATREVLPHVLFKADLTPQEELALAESGTLIDLAPLLEANAPNFTALLNASPTWREAITHPDGKIVALPNLTSPARQVAIWINRDWLSALGKELPKTPDAYLKVLRAIRDGDPNNNGKKDEIPLLITSPWEAKWLQHAFGLTPNDYNIYTDSQGELQFAPFQPAFYDFLQFLRILQDEGLIPKDAFRQQYGVLETTEKDVSPPRLGGMVSFAPYMLLKIDYTEQYVALPPLAQSGEPRYRDLLGDVWGGTFAITKSCPDPAKALAWVDQLYAEPGAVLAVAGQEGADWSWNDEGYWGYMIDQFRSIDAITGESLIGDAPAAPMLEPRAFWGKIDIQAERHVMDQSNALAPYLVRPMAPAYPTGEQAAQIQALQDRVGRAVDEGIARFATGEWALTEEGFKAFQQELSDLGANDLLQAWREVYQTSR